MRITGGGPMKVTQEFEVAQPVSRVWDFFQDVPAVADCLPGAELLEERGDGLYFGRIEVKQGPITAAFEGEAKVEVDAAARTGTIAGKGVDKRGGSRGQVRVAYALTESSSGTLVSVNADVEVSGSAAMFGRSGLINEIAERLIGDFVTCLEAKLTATTEAEAEAISAGELAGFSLLISSLMATVARFFKRLFTPRAR